MTAMKSNSAVIDMAQHAAMMQLPSYVTSSFLGNPLSTGTAAVVFDKHIDDLPQMISNLLAQHSTRSLRVAVTKTLQHAPTYEIQSALIGILLIASDTGHIRESDQVKLKEILSCPLSPESRRFVNELSSIFTSRILRDAL